MPSPKKHATIYGVLISLLAFGPVICSTACDDSSDDRNNSNSDTDVDTDTDADSDTDGDADADADTDADGDADSDTDGDADADADADADTGEQYDPVDCVNYPKADNNFDVGSLIRNYSLWNKKKDNFDVCSYQTEGYELLLISFSTTWCHECAEDVPTLKNLATTYQGEVKIAEVFEDVFGSPGLENDAWEGIIEFDVVRTEPATQMSSDYGAEAYPTLPLIDLKTMRVLVNDCYHYPQNKAKNYTACIEDHLK